MRIFLSSSTTTALLLFAAVATLTNAQKAIEAEEEKLNVLSIPLHHPKPPVVKKSTCEIPGYPECHKQSQCWDKTGCCYHAGACLSYEDNNCHPWAGNSSYAWPPHLGKKAIRHIAAPSDDGCICATVDVVPGLKTPNPNEKCELEFKKGHVIKPKTDKLNCWGTLECNPWAPSTSLCKQHGLCRGEHGEYVHVDTFCWYGKEGGEFKMCGKKKKKHHHHHHHKEEKKEEKPKHLRKHKHHHHHEEKEREHEKEKEEEKGHLEKGKEVFENVKDVGEKVKEEGLEKGKEVFENVKDVGEKAKDVFEDKVDFVEKFEDADKHHHHRRKFEKEENEEKKKKEKEHRRKHKDDYYYGWDNDEWDGYYGNDGYYDGYYGDDGYSGNDWEWENREWDY